MSRPRQTNAPKGSAAQPPAQGGALLPPRVGVPARAVGVPDTPARVAYTNARARGESRPAALAAAGVAIDGGQPRNIGLRLEEYNPDLVVIGEPSGLTLKRGQRGRAEVVVETFGKNELGIWAIQFSREKLVALASESFTRARNRFDERGIAYGNTAEAIRRFKEALFYLQTIDPKPDFHGELVSLLAQAEDELGRRYEEQRFLADRALNLKEWSAAARELRILRELIPDRSDPR